MARAALPASVPTRIEWLNVPGASSSMRRRASWLRSVRSSSVSVVVMRNRFSRNGSTPRATTPEAMPLANAVMAARHPSSEPEKNQAMAPAKGASTSAE